MITSQSQEMLDWGGNNWLRRNRPDMGKDDKVFPLLPDDLGPEHKDRRSKIRAAGFRITDFRTKAEADDYAARAQAASGIPTAVYQGFALDF